jgi:replicative DNA helicase
MNTILHDLRVDALFNQVSEASMLGCILAADAGMASEILAAIDAAVFTHQPTIDAIAACRAVVEAGRLPDVPTVWARMHLDGKDPGQFLGEAWDLIPSPAAWPYHFEVVMECHRRRLLAAAGESLASASRDANLDPEDALKLIAGANERRNHDSGVDSKTVTGELIDDIEKRFRMGDKLTGISYGIPILDRMTDGLQAGEYVVVAARPSIGKTAMAVTLLNNMTVQQGEPSVFITLETKPLGIHRRLLANVSGVPLGLLRSGRVVEQYQRITVANGQIAKAPVRYHYGLGTMDGRAAANVIRSEAKRGCKVAFIDYLQHLKVDGSAEKRTYGIGANSAEIKRACDETGVAVVALAQLNRGAEDDERLPRLSDIAECGQIERDADTVMLLHRKREETIGEGCIIVAKARDGECGLVPLAYHGPTVRFTERSKLEQAR